jgi:cytidyltransferase-like protein
MKTLIAGTFDNFHVGHQWFIWSAIQQGTEVCIIVARDTTVTRLKKQTPANTELNRLARIKIEIAEQKSATARLGRSDADFWETIREEAPDQILLGYDQNVTAEAINKTFPDIVIKRCTAYEPDFFKSSKF